MKFCLLIALFVLIALSSCKTSRDTAGQSDPRSSQTIYAPAPGQPSQISAPEPASNEDNSGIAIQDEMERLGRDKASMECSLLEMKKESQSGGTFDQARYNQIEGNLKAMNDKLKTSYTADQLQKIEAYYQRYMDDCAYKGF